MDKDFEKKIKDKKRRKILLISLAVIIGVLVIVGTNIEKAEGENPPDQGIITSGEVAHDSNHSQDTEKGQDDGNKDKENKDNRNKKSENKESATQNSSSKEAGSEQSVNTKKKVSATIEIRCDNLSNDLSKLEDEALVDYVPQNGTILKETEVWVEKGSSVFDVLNRICRLKKIQVESSFTPIYESYYVESINYLYEFDGGKLSGWMYKVNGKFPNYGCSEYKVKEGDKIIWLYTCNLGKDVGNEFKE